MTMIELVERQLTHALVNVVEGTLNLILFKFLVDQAGLVPTIDDDDDDGDDDDDDGLT